MKRLVLLLLLPGGLLFALGLGIAWAGLVLLLPGLRRLSTALPSTRDVGAAAVAPPQADQSCPAGTPVTGSAPQPYGEPHEPGPRVPWAACGERGSSTSPSTGEPGRALEALGALPWNRGLHPLLWTRTPPRMWAPSKEAN